MEAETRYARSGDVSIAYQVTGDGPYDLVHVPPYVSHVELAWQVPGMAEAWEERGWEESEPDRVLATVLCRERGSAELKGVPGEWRLYTVGTA